MLYALTIRSPVAKGRLRSVESGKLPEGCMLIRAWDIPGRNRLENTFIPILANRDLSYIGEPVALLLGPDKSVLEECSKTCRVVADEETPVFTVDDAGGSRIAASREISAGDPDAAFANAASVVNGNYTTGIQEHWYAEPTGAVAWLKHNDGPGAKESLFNEKSVVVSTATQWPYHVKHSVSQALGLPSFSVLVEPALTGLHMDGKLWYPSLIACHAALGAWITKKPVRLLLTRQEDFSFSPKRFGTEINIASAHDEKGKLTGLEVKARVNLGAFEVNENEILDQLYLGCMEIYKTDNIRFSGAAVKTNIPPQGPFAGFGLAEGFFSMERHVSHIADTNGLDPAEWRKDNYPALIKETVSGVQLIDTTQGMSDYKRKWASYELLRQHRRQNNTKDPSKEDPWTKKGEILRGIGLSLGCQGSGLLRTGFDSGYGVELVFDKDNSLVIKTSIVSFRGNYEAVWAGIASEILKIETDKITIHSDCWPDSGPSTMSRNITVLTSLVEQACIDINQQRPDAPLPITVRKTEQPPVASADSKAGINSFAQFGWASAVVEVEIDPVEFLPKIRGVWLGVPGADQLFERRNPRAAV